MILFSSNLAWARYKNKENSALFGKCRWKGYTFTWPVGRVSFVKRESTKWVGNTQTRATMYYTYSQPSSQAASTMAYIFGIMRTLRFSIGNITRLRVTKKPQSPQITTIEESEFRVSFKTFKIITEKSENDLSNLYPRVSGDSGEGEISPENGRNSKELEESWCALISICLSIQSCLECFIIFIL